ncbi:hypothetical protein Dalk_4610 [Desulfatibacillum aliphaticivorans]|uniref:Uncharacterized protein n=1 Tax=Desulfatibacillum aliphaticivorans TaxID=218208 RepID=B8FNK7_DESAL|nr:hypothetical protein [Desulfatibacillum aliphaticivorans]ACL06288.1 hypothetical protein Dalk_4610 [Desulfatibacillum aliphaticivorans]
MPNDQMGTVIVDKDGNVKIHYLYFSGEHVSALTREEKIRGLQLKRINLSAGIRAAEETT